MTTTVAQETWLNQPGLTQSPISSRLLIRITMKIRMNGSSTPFSTCESRIMRTSGKVGISTTPAPTTISERVEEIENRGFAHALVDAGFETQPLAHRVGRGKRQNTRPRKPTH
jgi:hypothetical protein